MKPDVTNPIPESSAAPVQKLSRQQKQILTLALRNKVRENRPFDACRGADVLYPEILAEVYGFPLQRPNPREHPGHNFDRQAIGPRRYNRAEAAVSRAIWRLESRGLVKYVTGKLGCWAGCSLSPEGLACAETVNTRTNPE
jgi:hypothetical protein